MKSYEVVIPVKKAVGAQYWIVDAESPDDAIRRWKAGEAVLTNEVVEVVDIGKPEVTAEVVK